MTTNKPLRVQIKPQIVALLEPIKPEHQTMSTFINDLLYQTSKGLTPYVTLNLSSEQSSPEKTKEKKLESADKFSNIESINKNKEKKKIDPFSSANIKKELIPDDLQSYTDLIIEWWPIRKKKGGVCSTKVANRIFDTLRSFPSHDRKEALENAITGGWKNLFPIKKSKFEQEAQNVPKPKYFVASEHKLPPTLAELGKTAQDYMKDK